MAFDSYNAIFQGGVLRDLVSIQISLVLLSTPTQQNQDSDQEDTTLKFLRNCHLQHGTDV